MSQQISAAQSRSEATAPTSETIELLHQRVSVRKYTDDVVAEETVEAVLRAAFRAPTSSNIQSYSVVIVRDEETKRRLSGVAGKQRHVAETPVFLAFCADLTRIERAMEMNGHTIANNNMETSLVSSIDAALVGMSVYLAAESLGLKGVMIGGVRNNAVETARILGLPELVYCVFGMCLGYPDEVPPLKPRMEYTSVVHYEQYGQTRGASDAASTVAAYDVELAKHYRGTGRDTTDDSWSRDMDSKFHPPLRDQLREELSALGFKFS